MLVQPKMSLPDNCQVNKLHFYKKYYVYVSQIVHIFIDLHCAELVILPLI